MSPVDNAPVGVGIIGAGVISTQYLTNLQRFPDVEVRFIADIDLERAAEQAAAHGVPESGRVEELLARTDVDVVVNLTIPSAHAEITQLILEAGKHVWVEKPIATTTEAAKLLLSTATAAGLRVACAPDTVLGAGLQTAFRAIARGDIGEPLTAITTFHVPGPDRWHPNPDFLFADGAGPLLDMGPYYLTALIHVFGSATRVHATSSQSQSSRIIGTGPRAGDSFPVLVPTHHSALIEFTGGRSAQSTFSFQHARRKAGHIEVNGTNGTLTLPDPNLFDGESLLWSYGRDEPLVIPAQGASGGRGTGVVDLVRSIRAGVAERASGALAAHVLEIMTGISDAAHSGSAVEITSSAAAVPLLPLDFDPTQAVS
ncbi:gfo/Idh/MocA family oxidoreductase [Nakamurella antarctica]|uniref:Gfo/Idh/MocA family oxidoreductase n=1 Tax=Nakamurella antarctica TaxID=1902245 RepID=A0A3G8ZL98_9ACTN|nr:Gfo/Idh/MocA family oxidoreductase [Nakamurella antarctica]AZI57605.1 gfo/Idh/MocA family oxidoreductase [Nakamurella antarctica]